MTTPKLLPAQTTHRCRYFPNGAFRCNAPAVARYQIKFTMPTGWVANITDHEQPICGDCLARCEETLRREKSLRWFVEAKPLGPVCPVCGDALDAHGNCTRHIEMRKALRMPFACDCYTCQVLGGDCVGSHARDAMHDAVRLHERAIRAVKGRAVLRTMLTLGRGSTNDDTFDRWERDQARGTGQSRRARRARERAARREHEARCGRDRAYAEDDHWADWEEACDERSYGEPCTGEEG